MPRQINLANLISLRGIISLYRRMHAIPESNINDQKDTDALAAALEKDEIIASATSRNLVYKLKGFPASNDPERAPGIDPVILDQLAQKVIDKFDLLKKVPATDAKADWDTFERVIFKNPDNLAPLLQKKYYKFLLAEERSLVDDFVARRLNELNLDDKNVVTYNVFWWDAARKDIRIDMLQVNRAARVATYCYFPNADSDLRILHIMRSDLEGGCFSFLNNALCIDLVLEGGSLNKRVHIELTVSDEDFYAYKFVKGIKTHTGFTPSANVIILKKADSFQDAEEKMNKGEIEEEEMEIAFAVSNKRIESRERNLLSQKKLESHKVYSLVELIAGSYTVGFISQSSKTGSKGNLGIGVCMIHKTGKVEFMFNKTSTLYCYVEDTYVGSDYICIMSYFIESQPEVRYNYYLNVVGPKIAFGEPPEQLVGVYASVSPPEITCGEIVFNRQKDFAKIVDLREAFLPGSHKPEEIKDKAPYVKDLSKALLDIEKNRKMLKDAIANSQ